MRSETTGTSSPEAQGETSERRRHNRLKRVSLVVAGVTMAVAAVFAPSEVTDNPAEAPAPVTRPVTVDQGEIDFRFTLEADIAKCHQLQPLDECIAGDLGSPDEELSPDQADVTYVFSEDFQADIEACHKLRQPLDDCIAGL